MIMACPFAIPQSRLFTTRRLSSLDAIFKLPFTMAVSLVSNAPDMAEATVKDLTKDQGQSLS
jgi:hypothetical protein